MKNRITIPSHSYQLIPIPTPFPFLKDLLQFPLKSKYRFPFLPVPCPKKTDWICVLIILWPYKVPHHTSEMSLQIAMQEQQGVQLIKSRFNCIYDLIQTLQEWFDQTVWYDTDFVESSHKADGNLHVQYIPISSHSHSNSCEKGFTFLFSWDPWEFPNLAHLYAAVESRSRPSCNRCTTGYNSFCSARSMLDNNRFLSTVRRIHKLWHGFRLFPSALSQSLITAMNFLLPLGGVYTAKRQ